MSDNEKIIIRGYKDLPPMPVSLGKMSVNDTGSWRNAEPEYIEHTPPCSFKCPAGNDVVGFLRLASEGRFREAWDLILETSPFPGVCGRVCPHPCESECNRQYLGGSINIHSIERFLADSNFEVKPLPKKIKFPNIKVAIIGSGPAGLSCAWQLNKYGYPVTVFESYPVAGGMMRVGIPDFRLPKKTLSREIEAIIASGTEIKTGITVGKDISFKEIQKRFSAVFLATGLHKSYSLGIEGEEHLDVVSGTEFLRKYALGNKLRLKNRVVVVGGGNTAIDTARTTLRMGSKVTLIYRRTRNEMPAISTEVDELLEEGVPIKFLTAPIKIHYKNGSIEKVECVRMKLGEPDASGRRKPIPITNSNFFIEADQIFTAIGETSDLSFMNNEATIEKRIVPLFNFAGTNIPGVFIGGDAATEEGTVTHAIGSGRKAAIAIRKYLEGDAFNKEDFIPPSLKNVNSRIVRFEDLNLDYFEAQVRVEASHLSPEERRNNFLEVHRGLSINEVLFESQRCMSCGICPECDNCYIFCPDGAVKYVNETGKKYEIEMKHCKGCGLCVAECPRFCLELHPIR